MDIDITVTVPQFIYNIYADTAKILGNCAVEKVMACALQAYAQHLFAEMQENGMLQDNAETE